jgi:hypothetical protein
MHVQTLVKRKIVQTNNIPQPVGNHMWAFQPSAWRCMNTKSTLLFISAQCTTFLLRWLLGYAPSSPLVCVFLLPHVSWKLHFLASVKSLQCVVFIGTWHEKCSFTVKPNRLNSFLNTIIRGRLWSTLLSSINCKTIHFQVFSKLYHIAATIPSGLEWVIDVKCEFCEKWCEVSFVKSENW